MRITTLMLQQNLTGGLHGHMTALAKAALEVSTGQRIQTVSDNPVDAAQIMRLNSQAGDIDQYLRNGTFATTSLSTEDAALSSLRDLLSQAKALTGNVTTPDLTDPSRAAALDAANQMKAQIIALGNTQVGDQFIFGGDQTTSAPFTPAGVYQGDSGTHTIAINAGVTMSVNHPGQPLITDSLAAVNNLITQLQTGSPAQIAAASSALDAASQQALSTQTEVGSRLQDLKSTSAQLGAQSTAILSRRDDLLTADPAQAIVQLQQEQQALQESYSVINIVMSTKLTDYLK